MKLIQGCSGTVLMFAFLAQCGIFFGELHAQSVEVLVLGTAQDAGHPQAGCEKSCCSETIRHPERQHWVSSIAFSDGEQFYIIDATPNFTSQLAMAKEHFQGQNLGGIFITHAHIGHYTGLMYLGREAMASLDVPVYVMPRMKKFLERNGPWDQLIRIHNIKLMELTDGQTVHLNDIAVTPMRVPHRDEYSETVGFRISGPTSSLLFIPDIDKWERWNRPIAEMVLSVDHILLDATFFSASEIPGRNMAEIPHPFVTETIDVLSSLPDEEKKKVHFIHLNHTNPLLRTDSDATNTVNEAGMQIARRGMTLPL
ncbi:MAG: MBL fold metallo-hydrolase [Cryomorphaceae bacterium]